jgi:hypothetical protein
MNAEIRYEFNRFITENKNFRLKEYFDDLSIEDGIMLQSFFEDFAEYILEDKKAGVEL